MSSDSGVELQSPRLRRTPVAGGSQEFARVVSVDTPRNDTDAEVAAVRRKPIIKTVLAAIVLFTIGSVMLYYGVQALSTDKDRAIGMLVVGSLAFLPGSYASWMLLGAALGWDGYSYDQIPSYDE